MPSFGRWSRRPRHTKAERDASRDLPGWSSVRQAPPEAGVDRHGRGRLPDEPDEGRVIGELAANVLARDLTDNPEALDDRKLADDPPDAEGASVDPIDSTAAIDVECERPQTC